MDVVVEVGGWEHECCGDAIERNQLVDLRRIRYEGPDGLARLAVSHHGGLDVPAGERVRGRVTEIRVVRDGGEAQAVHRVPSGQALRGLAEDDDGHLEDPWTGEVATTAGSGFLVTVRTRASGPGSGGAQPGSAPPTSADGRRPSRRARRSHP